MICPECKDKRHELCPRGTWCDCQHRVNSIWPEVVTLGATELGLELATREEVAAE